MSVTKGDRYRSEEGEVANVDRVYMHEGQEFIQYRVETKTQYGHSVYNTSQSYDIFIKKYPLKCDAGYVQSLPATYNNVPDWMRQ